MRDRDSFGVLASLCLVVGLAGCLSGVRAYEATTGDEAGLRYFLPAPYLVIQELSPGRWDAEIKMGVDRSREYTLQPYNYLANNSAQIDFETNGTLKAFKLTQDSTKVPQAMVEALRDIGLKDLELKKTALDEKLTKAGSAALQTSGGSAGDRRVFIYQIRGSSLIPMERDIILHFEAGSPALRSDAGAGGAIGGERKSFRSRDGGGFSAADIAQMKFYKGDEPVGSDATRRLRAETILDGDALAVPMSLLREYGVSRVVIGLEPFRVT